MKVYLDLVNQQRQNPIKRILDCCKNNTPKKQSMVILNSDNNYGLYVQTLHKVFKQLGMTEQSGLFAEKSLRDIDYRDFIIVGEEAVYENYDYRVTSDVEEVQELDGRKFKVYDLVNDLDKIISKLKKQTKPTTSSVGYSFSSKPATERFVRPTILDLTVEEKPQFRTPTKKVSYTEIFRPVEKSEKVTIFDNWVKIGMHQFDIYYDLCGREQINVDNKTLYINKDQFGRKYLAVR